MTAPNWNPGHLWPTEDPTVPTPPDQPATPEANPQQHDEVASDRTTADAAPPPLFFNNLDEFVREFVRHVFRRDVGETGRAEHRWSARWWETPEAVIRLEAIWRTWEQARLDPTFGISTWLRDHADYHMGVLMSPAGPFGHSTDTATSDEPLPYRAAPEGLF